MKNVSGQYRNPGTIQVVFYNSSGGIVGVRNTSAFAISLAPGDKTYLRYETTDMPPGWTRFDFNTTPAQSFYTPASLTVTDVNTVFDSLGRLDVLGAIVNDEHGCPSSGTCLVNVQVATYDQSGGIKNAAQWPVWANSLPYAKTFFDIPVNGPTDYATLEVKASGNWTWQTPPTPTSTITPTPTMTPTPTRTGTPTPTRTPTV